ncbi:MAG TPA: hypothetical protein VLX92_04365 [Kofleriaceae bacterium]|nr:hypothetical protein [Kofleriaceae bacterium]
MTGDAGLNPLGSFDPGFTATSPNKPLSIEVTISGETLGENGLPFQPVNPGDPQFVDGWSVSFEKYIVVIGNVRLSPNATQYTNQEQLNPVVATKPGPYVIDVHQLATNGFNGFVGADGEEPAGGIFKWDTQDDGTPFDSNTLYAFSYDTVPAQYPATQVNLTEDDFAIYDEMVRNHWNKYIEARADFVASGKYPDAPTEAKFESLAGGVYDSTMQAYTTPPQVHFVFGWNDATSSINCINPFNGDMDEANLMNRGVQPDTNGAVVAQVTIHTDHVFWDKLKQEGTPLRMDYIAAWAGADTNSTPLDLGTLGTKPLATTFSDGTPLPDRAPYLNNPTGTFTTDQTNPNQVTLDLNGVPSSDISGLSAFMAFSAQSQTHLNANGLCYIIGQNASDPFYQPMIAPAH